MLNQPDTDPAAPTIAAMPTPTPEATLRAQLESALAQNNELTTLNKTLTEHRETLKDKLAELEKNPFTLAISHMDAGQVLREAGEELSKLATLVRDREEAGTLTFKIHVKPIKDALDLLPELTVKEPKSEAPHTIFYADSNGKLTRQDPRQREFTYSDPK